MIKESEISNFIDLINHITEIKNLEMRNRSKRDKNRYQKVNEESTDQDQSTDYPRARMAKSSANMYNHRKLKVNLNKHKNYNSFKLDSIPEHSASENVIDGYQGSVPRERKNLYDIYCQDIHKRRLERMSHVYDGNQRGEHGKRNWEDAIVAQLDKCEEMRSLSKEKVISPTHKTKTLKSVLDNIRKNRKRSSVPGSKKPSSKKMQPSELNIGTFGETKMPKISQNSTHISELRSTYKVPFSHLPPTKKKKNARISKLHEITGWDEEDDRHKFLHVDLF